MTKTPSWTITLVTALWFFGLTMALGLTAKASAAPACEHRSAAHAAEHGGVKADSAWHVINGELPTCNVERSVPGEGSDHDNDNESRYCGRRWYC